MTQKMKQFNSLKKTTRVDFATYFGVIAAFVIVTVLQSNGSLKRSAIGLLVPHLLLHVHGRVAEPDGRYPR